MPSLGASGPVRGGLVAEAVVGQAGSLNPLFASEDNARDLDSLVYQGLTQLGADGQVEPLLAKSFAVSDDHLSYLVRLRSDVLWADGQPFGLDDVLFTYGVLQNPGYSPPDGQFWRDVKIEAAGSDSLRFTLKAPSASFPLDLRTGIVPAHVFRSVAVGDMAADPHSGAKAFGTGPFQVESVSADHKLVTLKRNPRARPAPFLDHFVFRSYASLADALDAVSRGEADSVGALQPPQIGSLSKRPDLTVREVKTYALGSVLMNLSPDLSTYLNPPAVRQALNQAIDRKTIVKKVLEGHADTASSPIPPSNWGYDPASAQRYPYDPTAAAATLTLAGWVLPPGGTVRSRGGTEFSLTLSTPDAYPYRQVAEEVSRQLAAVGIQLKVSTVPASVLVGRMLLQRQYQLAMITFDVGPDPDQYSFWHTAPAPDTLNFASTLTPRQALIDKDLEDGRTATDRGARQAAYADFQALIADAAPAIFLYSPHYFYVVSKRVHGVRLATAIEPVDRFARVAEWNVPKAAA